MSKLYDFLNSLVGKVNSSVKVEEQAFDDVQKTQARTNIGAASAEDTFQAGLLATLAMPGSLKWDGVIGDKEHIVQVEDDKMLIAMVHLTDEVPDMNLVGEAGGNAAFSITEGAATVGFGPITPVEDMEGCYETGDGMFLIATQDTTVEGFGTLKKGIWAMVYSLLPSGYDISLVYGSALMIPSWSFGDTSGSGGEYFETVEQTVNLGDTLTWDGNTDGLVIAGADEGMVLAKVSDAVPTINELANATFLISDGTQVTNDGTLDCETDGLIVFGEFVWIALVDGVQVGDLIIPKAGTYFLNVCNESYVSSLTIPGYNFTATEKATVIKTEHLPEALQFGEITTKGDTLTWDGNTEGLENVESILFKVSDVTPTMEDLANGCVATLNSGEGLYDVELNEMGWITIAGEAVIIVPEDFTDEYGTITKGIYFLCAEGIRILSLTIPGYNGFDAKTIHPLNEKYLPESIPNRTEVEEMIPKKLPNPHALTINGTAYDGSEPVEISLTSSDQNGGAAGVDKAAVNALIDTKLKSVKSYGAVGDGVTDDTAAFKAALEAERRVFVPGGTYVLSGTLVIRENCGLELSQDTVLQFTKTDGNCIEMRGSAVLRGNHAVLVAPYALTGNVISMDTLLDGTNHASIPPYEKSCPQWKRQRFAYDVNIVKPNSSGFNRPLADGKCSGTAIYMSATNVPSGTDNPDNADITFLWGVSMSGIRIAGGFSYGIHAVNYDSGAPEPEGDADDAWNHDMRIEAVIEGCEIGVCLDNCNGAHLNVTVQPNTSNPGGTKYAKQGVCLKDSRFVDMMRSRVWDWQVARTDSAEYKHLALYGNCCGLLLDDYLVHEHSEVDIRDDIYTDTPSNFETMTVLQEPANKWFKSIDDVPYFNNGITNRKLMLATDKFSAEQAEFIHGADGYYEYIPNYTNRVDGYQDGYYLLSDGSVNPIADNYTTTDFIKIVPGKTHTYRIGGEGIVWKDAYGYGRIAWYDSDKKIIGMGMAWNKVGASVDYPAWVDDESVESAFVTLTSQAMHAKAEFFRITARGSGADLIVTIDEPQEDKAIWHGQPKRLDESIYAQKVYLTSPGGKSFEVTVSDSGALTATEVTV